MTTLTMGFPETVFAAMRDNPRHFAQELRLAAAAFWYGQGKISQEIGACIAGLDRTDFLMALAKMGKDSFVVDFDDLDEELDRG